MSEEDTPDSSQPSTSDWVAKIVKRTGPRRGEISINELLELFAKNFGDAIGVDCSRHPLQAIELAEPEWPTSDRIQISDYHPLDQEKFCTLRLQTQLQYWMIQHLPKLFEDKYQVCSDLNVIDQTTNQICSTVGDYKLIGIIKSTEKSMLLDNYQIRTILDNCWDATIRNIKAPDTGHVVD